MTLEHNLAAVKKDAKLKNPAGLNRSQRLIEDGGGAAPRSGYAAPVPVKPPKDDGSKKKNNSAYL